MNVFGSPGRRSPPLVAPAFSRWAARADHFWFHEETGIAMRPDGRSLITSISTQQNAVWIHDSKATALSPPKATREAVSPIFSRDGERSIICRVATRSSPPEWYAPIWLRQSEVVLPGVSISATISRTMKKKSCFRPGPPGSFPRYGSPRWTAALPRRGLQRTAKIFRISARIRRSSSARRWPGILCRCDGGRRNERRKALARPNPGF